MEIGKFITQLSPTLDTETVFETIRTARSDLERSVIPSTDSAANFFKSWKLKSPALIGMEKVYRNTVDIRGSEKFFTDIHETAKNTLKLLDEIKKRIETDFGDDVVASGLTYQTATLLQVIEAITFFNRYTRKFLGYVWCQETRSYQEEAESQDMDLPPETIDWITANFVHFCSVSQILRIQPKGFFDNLSSVPDVLVTAENVKMLPVTVGRKKIDPFNFGFIPKRWNPLWYIQMYREDHLYDSYKEAQADSRILEARRLNLELIVAKKPDPALQKKISLMQSDIDGLQSKIKKYTRQVEG